MVEGLQSFHPWSMILLIAYSFLGTFCLAQWYVYTGLEKKADFGERLPSVLLHACIATVAVVVVVMLLLVDPALAHVRRALDIQQPQTSEVSVVP
jgi:hypothetical protein